MNRRRSHARISHRLPDTGGKLTPGAKPLGYSRTLTARRVANHRAENRRARAMRLQLVQPADVPQFVFDLGRDLVAARRRQESQR
jgi:hypothetical protein